MSWKLEQADLGRAADLGELVAATMEFTAPPIDPFTVIESEGERLQACGDHFGDAFDGRLEYHDPMFLLFYNSKYDIWHHSGLHHPKVRFTVAHELGHYFLDEHRRYLMRGGGSHGSYTEFESANLVEREADFFATGLLMPQYLLRKRVNREAPTIEAVRAARDEFDVSLTSMMVRWVQLCDFPCSVVSVSDDRIEWGFTSEGFKLIGGRRVRRGESVTSRGARAFLNEDPSLTTYRDGDGWSIAERWIDFQRDLEVHEDFIVIPSTRQMLVFVTADESDIVDE